MSTPKVTYSVLVPTTKSGSNRKFRCQGTTDDPAKSFRFPTIAVFRNEATMVSHTLEADGTLKELPTYIRSLTTKFFLVGLDEEHCVMQYGIQGFAKPFATRAEAKAYLQEHSNAGLGCPANGFEFIHLF